MAGIENPENCGKAVFLNHDISYRVVFFSKIVKLEKKIRVWDFIKDLGT